MGVLQAKRGETDVLICDTSGRLHTNFELMEELGSCKEALSKRMKDAPHEVLLVLDGTTGRLRSLEPKHTSMLQYLLCCPASMASSLKWMPALATLLCYLRKHSDRH